MRPRRLPREEEATLVEHLDELRGRIVISLAAVALATAVAFAFHDHILEWLALGRVDLGVVYNPPPSPAVELRPLAAQQLCLISRPATRAAKTSRGIALRRLPDYPLIIPSRPHTIRMLVESRLAAVGLKPHIALEVDGVAAILDLVTRGHGHAVLARNALIEAGDAARLIAQPIVAPALRTVMSIAISAQRPLTRMAAETATLIAELGPPLLES